jgi:protein TonB
MARRLPAPARFADTPALSRRARGAVLAVIVLAHGVLGYALVRAFGGVQALAGAVGLGPVLTATVVADKPPPPARAVHSHQDEGASGAAGKRARADQIVANAHFDTPALTAPPVAGSGSDTRSGAAAAGEGTGGTVSGSGTGSGGTGTGLGGHYVATRPVKIAGDLVEGDYPRAGRARRLGTAVIVLLTVGTDGRVTACRVHQPSGDPEADAVTCKLALERFRFNPALDRNGAPVESLFGWQQRFFWK